MRDLLGGMRTCLKGRASLLIFYTNSSTSRPGPGAKEFDREFRILLVVRRRLSRKDR